MRKIYLLDRYDREDGDMITIGAASSREKAIAWAQHYNRLEKHRVGSAPIKYSYHFAVAYMHTEMPLEFTDNPF